MKDNNVAGMSESPEIKVIADDCAKLLELYKTSAITHCIRCPAAERYARNSYRLKMEMRRRHAWRLAYFKEAA
jgi:hypothetical protein